MRINKYLSECGVCSRREADVLIEEGLVMVNETKALFGMQVEENDLVTVRGEKVCRPEKHVYLAFYKPVGIVCTAEKKEKNNLIEFLNYPRRITYAGRLDKESEGLLLLTDDGDLIDALMTGSNGHEKEYVVTVAHSLTKEKLQKMAAGLYLEDIKRHTKPCKVWKSGEEEFHIVLTQGINRQIRRMCKQVGLRVTRLERIRIGEIRSGNLAAGKYRELNEEEFSWLKKLKENSRKSNLR